jgi:hypothetical protein
MTQQETRESGYDGLRTADGITLLILTGLFFLACFWAQNSLAEANWRSLNVWLQFFIGNWPNWQDANIDHTLWTFSAAVAFRFTLAYTPIYGVILLLVRLKRWWKVEAMKYRDLLKDRDLTMITFLENMMPPDQRTPELREKLIATVDAAAKSWEEEQLPALLADKALAERLVNQNIPQG